MKQCKKCGIVCEDSQNFCGECGSNIESRFTYICNYCGRIYDVGSVECPKCHAKPDIQLKTASDRFRIIDNNDWTLYIPIDEESSGLIYRLRNAPETLSRKDYRVLGKYSLHLFSTRLTKIRNEIAILDEQNRLAELVDPDLYSKECGLGYEDESGKAIFV